jgi:hypothetical protein
MLVTPVSDTAAAEDVAEDERASDSPRLIAYPLYPNPAMRLVPATNDREWMTATNDQFAKRCLPLLIANQAGWFVLNSHHLRVTWDGGDRIEALQLEWLSGDPPYPAVSHFGHGILTWHLPYLFRTEPGYQLHVRGPANWPRDGIHALEGIVETDWSVATFTMNWKMTRTGHPVEFGVGEPVCVLAPTRVALLEELQPEFGVLDQDEALAEGYRQWSTGRSRFNAQLKIPGSDATRRKWQREYFHGKTPSGKAAREHRTKLRLREFPDSAIPLAVRADATARQTSERKQQVSSEQQRPPVTTGSRPRRAESISASMLDDDLVLYAAETGQSYALNAVGRTIWELCDGTSSVEEIAGRIASSYGIPVEQALSDTQELIDELAQAQLIELG